MLIDTEERRLQKVDDIFVLLVLSRCPAIFRALTWVLRAFTFKGFGLYLKIVMAFT
jgi:hypothetical protein